MLKSSIRLLASLALLTTLLAPVAPARAEVFFTVRELLSAHFSKSERVGHIEVELSADRRARLERKLGKALGKARYTFFVARSGGKVDGYALFDQEKGQHEPIGFATFFDPRGRVTRVEVVAYREPYGDGIRSPRFRQQFVGRDASSGFGAKDGIDAISGATISSRSLSVGVQRASLLLRETLLNAETVIAKR
ncbi:MAG: FMN-binding protein [Myxococcales bacterium]|nr:FMN-binding protein [Myxococcales bacterium]